MLFSAIWMLFSFQKQTTQKQTNATYVAKKILIDYNYRKNFRYTQIIK